MNDGQGSDAVPVRNGEDGPRAALRGLFRGKTAHEWRALYAGAFDWGPDIGRETAEE
jgi:hypothetical protein